MNGKALAIIHFLQTESDLYLLVTFHNLSAPFTVDCEGAYIEVEREKNGFEARWCGNRVTQVCAKKPCEASGMLAR